MTTQFIMRLDDACEFMNRDNWERMEKLLDSYGIKPIVSIIPFCEDESLIRSYCRDESFWDTVKRWKEKDWIIGLHGFNHVYTNYKAKGLNPINSFSEFVDLPLAEQEEKIRLGISVLKSHDIYPEVFVAPGHSFDKNTLIALKTQSNITCVSDTIAFDRYKYHGLIFIPQQCGAFRRMPLKTITGCYHPNTMSDQDFVKLESFLLCNKNKFISSEVIADTNRSFTFIDYIIRILYLVRNRIMRSSH